MKVRGLFRRYGEMTRAAADRRSTAATVIKLGIALIKLVIVVHGWW